MESILNGIKIKRQKTIYLFFICSGNICRSPMAEILCESILQQDPLPFFEETIIKSGAVTYSWTGRMDNYAEAVLKQFYRISQKRLDQFKSCHIDRDPSRCRDADLIIVMEQYHIPRIPKQYQSKTFTLSELATGVPRDVDDPYGGSISDYKETAIEIYGYLQQFLKNLRDLI